MGMNSDDLQEKKDLPMEDEESETRSKLDDLCYEDSTSKDDSRLRSPSSPSKFSKRADGKEIRPAEVFRTDFITAMKVADSQMLQPGKKFTLSDTWKQEWEKGVQVPVNSEALPSVSLRLKDTQPPTKRYSSFCLPKNRVTFVNPEYAHTNEKHSACNYDLDDLDVRWLSMTKTKNKKDNIDESVMEKVMTYFEGKCFEKMAHAVATKKGLSIEYDETTTCDVCLSPDTEETNEIVFCDACNMCAHQACYGIPDIPTGTWLCRPCSRGILSPRCVLCPNRGGAMKRLKNGFEWIHVICAWWVPEVKIEDTENVERITIDKIPASRKNLNCQLCREKMGACIQCSVKRCVVAYHVTCGVKNGLELKTIMLDEKDDVQHISYCKRHCQSQSTDNQKQRPGDNFENQRLQELQKLHETFYKLININKSAKELRLKLDMARKIFSYWVLKRRANENRPLIPLTTEQQEKLSGKQGIFLIQEQFNVEMERFALLRQDLERLRNLCYLIIRRERVKREVHKTAQEVLLKKNEILSDENSKLSDDEFENIASNPATKLTEFPFYSMYGPPYKDHLGEGDQKKQEESSLSIEKDNCEDDLTHSKSDEIIDIMKSMRTGDQMTRSCVDGIHESSNESLTRDNTVEQSVQEAISNFNDGGEDLEVANIQATVDDSKSTNEANRPVSPSESCNSLNNVLKMRRTPKKRLKSRGNNCYVMVKRVLRSSPRLNRTIADRSDVNGDEGRTECNAKQLVLADYLNPRRSLLDEADDEINNIKKMTADFIGRSFDEICREPRSNLIGKSFRNGLEFNDIARSKQESGKVSKEVELGEGIRSKEQLIEKINEYEGNGRTSDQDEKDEQTKRGDGLIDIDNVAREAILNGKVSSSECLNATHPRIGKINYSHISGFGKSPVKIDNEAVTSGCSAKGQGSDTTRDQETISANRDENGFENSDWDNEVGARKCDVAAEKVSPDNESHEKIDPQSDVEESNPQQSYQSLNSSKGKSGAVKRLIDFFSSNCVDGRAQNETCDEETSCIDRAEATLRITEPACDDNMKVRSGEEKQFCCEENEQDEVEAVLEERPRLEAPQLHVVFDSTKDLKHSKQSVNDKEKQRCDEELKRVPVENGECSNDNFRRLLEVNVSLRNSKEELDDKRIENGPTCLGSEPARSFKPVVLLRDVSPEERSIADLKSANSEVTNSASSDNLSACPRRLTRRTKSMISGENNSVLMLNASSESRDRKRKCNDVNEEVSECVEKAHLIDELTACPQRLTRRRAKSLGVNKINEEINGLDSSKTGQFEMKRISKRKRFSSTGENEEVFQNSGDIDPLNDLVACPQRLTRARVKSLGLKKNETAQSIRYVNSKLSTNLS